MRPNRRTTNRCTGRPQARNTARSAGDVAAVGRSVTLQPGMAARLGGAFGKDETPCIVIENRMDHGEVEVGMYFTRTEYLMNGDKRTPVSVLSDEKNGGVIARNAKNTYPRPQYRGVTTRGDRELIVCIRDHPGDASMITKIMRKSLSGKHTLFMIHDDHIEARESKINCGTNATASASSTSSTPSTTGPVAEEPAPKPPKKATVGKIPPPIPPKPVYVPSSSGGAYWPRPPGFVPYRRFLRQPQQQLDFWH